MRRLIRDISSVLIISGLLLMLDAGVTLLWQEPVTAVIGTIQRGEIDKRFLSLETTPLSPVDMHALVTVAIAGHRTTYLAPFRHIDELKPGDRIMVTMPYARFTYVVQYHRIVLPTALWVTKDVGYDRLVLSACNPLYSAAQRIIVFAKLSQVDPLGPARATA